MDYSDKIKALQEKAGIEKDGVASSKTWLHVYYLLFNSVPYDLNTEILIKNIQHKLNLRFDAYVWDKTWDALYDLLIGEDAETEITPIEIEESNSVMLQTMPKEVVLFAKELIYLAAKNGIIICLMDKPKKQKAFKNKKVACSNFGLSFYVGVFEKNNKGKLVHVEDSPSYAKVAKLGASIGLTYNHESKYFKSSQMFDVVPAWAVRLNETEMVQELSRRKMENINLLAIL